MSKIVVCHCNRPDFLRLQIESYFRTCEDLDEMIVVNDGSTVSLRTEISAICANHLNVRELSAPDNLDHTSASSATSSVLQWAYDTIERCVSSELVAFFDSDMFPLRKFRISEFIPNNKSLSALKQTRGAVDYVWNGIFFVDFRSIPARKTLNWSCGSVSGEKVDSGGLMHHYLEKNGRNHVHYLKHTSHITQEQISSLLYCPDRIKNLYDVTYRMEVFEDTFLHYGRASNWETQWLSPQDFNKKKTAYMIEWLKENGVIS